MAAPILMGIQKGRKERKKPYFYGTLTLQKGRRGGNKAFDDRTADCAPRQCSFRAMGHIFFFLKKNKKSIL